MGSSGLTENLVVAEVYKNSDMAIMVHSEHNEMISVQDVATAPKKTVQIN